MYGWTGKIAYIDLTERKVHYESLPADLLHAYIGGRGLNARLLYDMTDADTDPLGPANPLIFSTSPLTGTLVPANCRYTVTARSPLTGIFGDGSAQAGYDERVGNLTANKVAAHTEGLKGCFACPIHFTLTRLAPAVHCIGEPNMDKWLTTPEIMRMVTRNGARAARLDRTSGTLEAGKQADLVLYDINSVRLTPLNDPYRLLAWCENGSSVDTVMIDGEVVVENGKVLTVDEEQVKKDAREMVRAIPVRNKEIFRVIEEITPLLAEGRKRRFAAQQPGN